MVRATGAAPPRYSTQPRADEAGESSSDQTAARVFIPLQKGPLSNRAAWKHLLGVFIHVSPVLGLVILYASGVIGFFFNKEKKKRPRRQGKW